MIGLRVAIGFALAAMLGGCATSPPSPLPRGAAAYEAVAATPSPGPAAYALRPGDTIAVDVYREPELSAAKLVVDEAGHIQMPLIGQVEAAGQTAAALSARLAQSYGTRYLRNPRVTVQLLETQPRTVSVEGEVNQPGVFPIGANETLLTTLARARSPSDKARRDEVVVFRLVDGQRMGAVFDLDAIRAGRAADPQIREGDIVVVGFSQIKGAWRDFLSATPLLYAFTVF